MTEARRLLEAGSEHERALLRAGAEEAPTQESVRAAARMLGLMPRAAVLASFAALLAKAVKWSSLHGYILASALAVGALATAYVVTSLHARNASTAPMHVVVAPAPGPMASVEPLPAVRDRPASDSTVARIARPQGTPARSLPASAGAHDASSEALSEQVLLIDHARALVASGDADGALRAVDTYAHRFPGGLLSEEASLIRIQAVAARGDRAEAAALAQRFRAEYPRSVHTSKIQWLLGDSSK